MRLRKFILIALTSSVSTISSGAASQCAVVWEDQPELRFRYLPLENGGDSFYTLAYLNKGRGPIALRTNDGKPFTRDLMYAKTQVHNFGDQFLAVAVQRDHPFNPSIQDIHVFSLTTGRMFIQESIVFDKSGKKFTEYLDKISVLNDGRLLVSSRPVTLSVGSTLKLFDRDGNELDSTTLPRRADVVVSGKWLKVSHTGETSTEEQYIYCEKGRAVCSPSGAAAGFVFMGPVGAFLGGIVGPIPESREMIAVSISSSNKLTVNFNWSE